MSEFFICNKYIYIYICLFHFVANEEKLLIRYNGGEKNGNGNLLYYLKLKVEKNFTID